MSMRIISRPLPGSYPTLVPRPGALLAPEAAEALLPSVAASRLRDGVTLAVTTGQQPGLFGGPMYVLHKALAARAVATELERRWQRPVVPVFWLAGDDHDWDEATRTAWWTARGDVVTWALRSREPNAPQHAMAHEPLPDDVRVARDRLADDLPSGDARDTALAWIDRHWHAGATVHGAFAAGVHELLTPLGVACIDPTTPAFKRAQVPWIARALEQSDALDATLAALPGPEGWVGAGQGWTLVFLEASMGRDRLRKDGREFVTRRGGERFSHDELQAMLEQQPERFSANVLLRPVIEAALLPTVGYVAGPGEFRYLQRQASALYPVLDVVPQVPVPRWGGAVLDATGERLLARLGIAAADVMVEDDAIGRRLLRDDLPPEMRTALATLRGTITAQAAALTPPGEAIDAVLPRAIASRQHRLNWVVDDLEKLLLRHLRLRDDITSAQYRRVRTRLMPLDAPQERIIGVAAALGTFGGAWLEAAAEAATVWTTSALRLAELSEVAS